MDGLISKYIVLTTEHGISIQSGEDSKSNTIHSKIQKLITRIAQSETKIKSEFYGLLGHSNSSVRCWTAIELIETDKKKSLDILNEIATEKGIIGLNAQTLINMWKKGLVTKLDWKKVST
jgi:hypothetical protein